MDNNLIQDEENNTQAHERLYAGKFKTIEDLEAGYKNAARVYEENNQLKQKVDNLSSIPDDYLIPENVALSEAEIEEIKNIAKSSGLTQQHFEKVASQWSARNLKQKESFELAQKSLGEENVNLLKDWVSKSFPEEVQADVYRKYVTDAKAREKALQMREAQLNSSVPGLSGTNTGPIYRVTDKDILEAREAANKDSRKVAHYVNLLSIQAKQNGK